MGNLIIITENKSLIDILKKETKSLKEQYMMFTNDYARKKFDSMVVATKYSIEEWYDLYSIKYTVPETGYGKGNAMIDSGEYRKKDLYRMRDDRHRCFTIVNGGFDKYLAKELKYAEMHYESSVIKLANRIEKKGLDIDNLSVTTSHIGVNINTTLTDGEKTVRAFTIVASGDIQRPHYRYLVK